MQVPDGQHFRRFAQLRANFEEHLCPPVKRAAQELDGAFRHLFVFVR